MDVKNCKGCGRLFNFLQGPQYCPACREGLEDAFVRVKQYIEEHKGASINEVSQENEVSVRQLKQWVREERLSFSEDSDIGVPCEKCGKTIRTGRFCAECKATMANNLSQAYKKEEKEEKKVIPKADKNKMRFLDTQK